MTNTTNTPLCLHCVTNEVAAPFTYPDGSGFCSFACETSANEEADLAHADMGRCVECGGYAATYFPTGEPACRGCWSYEDEDYHDQSLAEYDEDRKLLGDMA
jgi:hypothetical protein